MIATLIHNLVIYSLPLGLVFAMLDSRVFRRLGDLHLLQQQIENATSVFSDHVMGTTVAIGKATKEAWPKPGQLPLDEVVIENGFKQL